MPLAIELAAGRLATFGLADLADRLDRSLDLLGGGRPSVDARHRTLRATTEWSYQLLPEDGKRLFRHLSVFADGVDLATAEAVAGELSLAGDPANALAHLVDASMIDAAFEDRTRYRMLETLRTFGLDRLRAAGEGDQAERRLVRWAVTLTGWIDAVLTTEREPEADAALRREVPNLRAAWRLARRQQSLDDAVALVIAFVRGDRVARCHRSLGLGRGSGSRRRNLRPIPGPELCSEWPRTLRGCAARSRPPTGSPAPA